MSSLPDDERYEWAEQWKLWIIVKYDYGTGQWGFKQYMPRGWHPPNPAQQTSHAHGEFSQAQTGYSQAQTGFSQAQTGYAQAGVEEQGIGQERANDEADDNDDEECNDQGEGQGEENSQDKYSHIRVDSTTSPLYSYPASSSFTTTGASPSSATAASIRLNSTSQTPMQSAQQFDSTGSVQHTSLQPGGWPYGHPQMQSNQSYQQAHSSYPQSTLTPSSYAQRILPRGRGQDIQGTYQGPSTLHYETIDPSFYVRSKDFFFEGRVFAVIMNETAGSSSRTQAVDYNTSKSYNAVKYKDNIVYTNVRRFVVVRTKREFCFACPIFTYSQRATTKPGVKAIEHGIIYSWGRQPELVKHEGGMTKPSLPVVMSESHQVLDIASRIYYGIHHPIQYNIKAKDIGYIPKDLIPTLIGNWREEDEGNTQQEFADTQAAEDPDVPDDENSLNQQISKLSVSGKSTSGSKHSKSSGHKKKH